MDALAAFERLWKVNLQIKLHIVGRLGWQMNEAFQTMLQHPENGHRLWIDPDANDDVLQRAYASADIVLMASHIEGFGLPIVEAAVHGKPLIVSSIPSHREICGANAIYFLPGNIDDLTDRLREWLTTGAAPAPPKPFTWAESADELMRLLVNFYRLQA